MQLSDWIPNRLAVRQFNLLRYELDLSFERLSKKMAQIDDAIANLTADVAAEKVVVGKAVALINGIPAMIQTAITEAQALGATPTQLAAISAAADAINAQRDEVSAALANAPASTTTTTTDPNPPAA